MSLIDGIRRSVAASLLRVLEPRQNRKIAEALDHGARLLDIGRSLDFVARHEVVADLVLATGLDGFTHEELALVSALVRRTGDRHADTKTFGTLITDTDRAHLHRAAVVLALADAIEARCPRGRTITLKCAVGRNVTVSVPQLMSWRALDLGQRFERAFRKPLIVVTGA